MGLIHGCCSCWESWPLGSSVEAKASREAPSICFHSWCSTQWVPLESVLWPQLLLFTLQSFPSRSLLRRPGCESRFELALQFLQVQCLQAADESYFESCLLSC